MRSQSWLSVVTVAAVVAAIGATYAIAAVYPDQVCTPAVAATPQCNGGCNQTSKFQNAAKTLCTFTCANNNCPGGTTTQTANPGTCSNKPESTCTGPLLINIQVQCGSCSCPVGTQQTVPCNSPPPCGCTWAAADPQPAGCPMWMNNIVTCTTP